MAIHKRYPVHLIRAAYHLHSRKYNQWPSLNLQHGRPQIIDRLLQDPARHKPDQIDNQVYSRDLQNGFACHRPNDVQEKTAFGRSGRQCSQRGRNTGQKVRGAEVGPAGSIENARERKDIPNIEIQQNNEDVRRGQRRLRHQQLQPSCGRPSGQQLDKHFAPGHPSGSPKSNQRQGGDVPDRQTHNEELRSRQSVRDQDASG